MTTSEISPGRGCYAVAAALFLAGVGLFVWFLFTRLASLEQELTQVVVPGETELVLDQPGTYTIFHEHRSFVGGRVYSNPRGLAGLECSLVSRRTGAEVPLTAPSGSMTYSLGGRSGVAILEFEIAEPGDYAFTASYPEGEEGPPGVLAIARGFMGKLFGTIFGAIGIFFGSAALAAVTAGVTFWKRSRAEKRLASGPAPVG